MFSLPTFWKSSNWFIMSFIDAVALMFAYSFWAGGLPLAAVVLAIVTAGINVVFLVDRFYPARWLSSGVFLLMLMVVYPVMFTVYAAFTNYSGQHVLSKQQVVDRLERQFYTPEGAASMAWRAYRSADGQFIIWLTDPEGNQFLADPAAGITPVDASDPRFGPVDDAVAEHEPAYHGREHQRQQRGDRERRGHPWKSVADAGDEPHRGRTGWRVRPTITPRAAPEPGTDRRSRAPRRPGGPGPPARRDCARPPR